MWFLKIRKNKEKYQNEKTFPAISITLKQVKQAVEEYETRLPKGANRTVLLIEGNIIDFTPIAHILGGLPDQVFYMSRETFEIFDEADGQVAEHMDRVQRAVDAYIEERGEYPVLSDDKDRKISYYLLEKHMYLTETPPLEFYLTDYDHLISREPMGKH